MPTHEEARSFFSEEVEGRARENIEGAQAELEEIEATRESLRRGQIKTEKGRRLAEQHIARARSIAAPFN